MTINFNEIKLRKTIKQVEDVQGKHTELCSLYIPSSKREVDVLNYIANEAVESNNIKDKSNRKIVQRSIATLAS